ncbi:hypothetical protein [Carboxylicivirga sp. N1Y90]|uniref:hypothetical protein n=1 Tax=Carboxylicivirga fragile TaxID=3417571 RepID=UPI003D333FC9|nr:hypothetical protein [Marinilabiliaceae bacterium N1Y90]
MKSTHFLIILFAIISHSLVSQTTLSKDYKTVYSQSFSSNKSPREFEFSDASKWLISKNGESGKALKCLGEGSYKNAHGGPRVVAIVKNYELEDFVMEMDVMQQGKNFELLDFCIFFGIEDQEHYSYAQLASKADKNTHNVFTINGDQPQRIGKKQEKGIWWGLNKWNHVKIERFEADKILKVYFNDELVLDIKDNDELFNNGLVGFGSSSSALKIDNLKIIASEYKESDKAIFPKTE